MAVYVYDADAFEKLVQVEGENYRRKGRDSSYSLTSFLVAWRELETRLSKEVLAQTYVKNQYGDGVIYGSGGINRYAVDRGGELVFLASFSWEECINKAREAGFRIG